MHVSAPARSRSHTSALVQLLALVPFVGLLTPLALPSAAHAGGCTPCTTHQDCVASTGQANALCIDWYIDFGCGMQEFGCCPGQGCTIGAGGAPSCEDTLTCERVGGPPGPPDASVRLDASDIGPADTGAQVDPDAETPAPDGGIPTANDAAATDGGGSPSGATTPRSSDSGCSCTAPPRPGVRAVTLIAIVALVALRLPRRRRT